MNRKTRQKLIETFLDKIAERGWREVSLAEVCDAAGVPLKDLIAAFPSKSAIVAAAMRDTDAEVLDKLDASLGEDPVREQLFDLLMLRLEVLAPHKKAIGKIARAAAADPALAARLGRALTRSMQTMMAACGVDTDVAGARMRAKGLALVYARSVRTWLNDEDPGLARTMADLDRRLRDGERMVKIADRAAQACSLACWVGAALARGIAARRRSPSSSSNGAARGSGAPA